MLYKVALVSAMLGVCSGFAPAPVVPRTAVMQRAGAAFMQETEEKAADTETKADKAAPAVVEYAESLPMLVKRPQLKGYVGDVGFDPLGFSEILPMVHSCRLSHSAASSPTPSRERPADQGRLCGSPRDADGLPTPLCL